MTPIEITAPTAEPLTLAEARVHLRQLSDADVTANAAASPDDDSWVQSSITACRQWVEEFLGVKLTDAVYRTSFDDFTDTTSLAVEGAAEIVALQYVDELNVVQTLAPTTDYTFDAWNSVIYAAADWPTLSTRANPIRVDYRVIAEGEAVFRADIKTAMLLLLGHLYENREATVVNLTASELPLGVETFLRPHRTRLGMA